MIFAFFLFFTHLIIKTDDGHFLGIMTEEGFRLVDWLRERYLTVSGRTVSELLLMIFLKINPIFWKAFSTAAFIYIVWFLQKICTVFSGALTQKQKNIFCCLVPYLVFIGALNSGAFWFAGSFTYLFPFVAFLLSVTPLTFEFFEIKYNKLLNITAVFAALLACSQEQTTALTLAFFAVLLIANGIKKNVQISHLTPLVTAVAGAVWLFASPGMRGRLAMEGSAFTRFEDMKFFEKILCGFANYFGYSFFMSVIVTGFFAVLIFFTVNSLYDNKAIKAFAKFFIAFFALVAAGINALYIAVSRAIPDKGFERLFKSGEYDFLNIVALAFGFALLAAFAAMLLLIIKKDKKLGFTAAVLFAASVASAVVLGFSSSIYASGQRVFFFTDILTLFACAVLISAGKDKRNVVAYKAAVIIALAMLILNCFNFAFLEIPIMG